MNPTAYRVFGLRAVTDFKIAFEITDGSDSLFDLYISASPSADLFAATE